MRHAVRQPTITMNASPIKPGGRGHTIPGSSVGLKCKRAAFFRHSTRLTDTGAAEAQVERRPRTGALALAGSADVWPAYQDLITATQSLAPRRFAEEPEQFRTWSRSPLYKPDGRLLDVLNAQSAWPARASAIQSTFNGTYQQRHASRAMAAWTHACCRIIR